MAVDYFQPETFQQANPILSGLSAGQQIYSQGIQNAYLPKTLAQQLQQLQLANQTTQAQLPYVGPQAAAQVGLTQAQIPLTQAQTGLVGAQTQFFPLTAQGQYLRGLGDYLRGIGMNSPGRMIASFQNDPGFQAMIANNPALARYVATNMTNAALYGGAGTPLPGLPNPIQQTAASAPSNTQIPATSQQQQTLDALKQSLQNGQQQGTNSLNSLLNPSDISAFSDALGSSAIKKTTPNQIQLQRVYSQSFDNQMQPWLPKLPNISNFAGAAGQANLTADKYAAAFNLKNTPQYQDWNAFVNAASELSGNELRRALGVTSSVSQKEDMDKLMEPAYWNEHPADALARWNALLSAKKANDQVLTLSQNQSLSNLRQQVNAPTFQYATQPGTGKALGNGQYQLVTKSGKVRTISDEDLAYTAQQNNMSVQQVKQRLGIQ